MSLPTAIERRARRRAAGDRERDGAERVPGLEGAEQRNPNRALLAEAGEGDALAEAFGDRVRQPDIRGRIAAIGDDALAAAVAEAREPRRLRGIDVKDGGAVRRQQLGEEPLGREIRLHIRVVIEMVAGEVGESGGGEREPVETELVEPMARGFERHMIDAGFRQHGEIAMQRHRIGRRQAAGLLDTGREGRSCRGSRFVAECVPDLAQEYGD